MTCLLCGEFVYILPPSNTDLKQPCFSLSRPHLWFYTQFNNGLLSKGYLIPQQVLKSLTFLKQVAFTFAVAPNTVCCHLETPFSTG